MSAKAVTYNEGEIYLRDRRNGNIHQYQDVLAQMSYMERFTYKKGDELVKKSGEFVKLNMSAQEKAADFDRLASMKPEERDAELARRAAYVEEQAELAAQVHNPTEPTTDPDGPPAGFRMTEKAGAVSYAKFVEQNWTDKQLLDKNYMEPVDAPEPAQQ